MRPGAKDRQCGRKVIYPEEEMACRRAMSLAGSVKGAKFNAYLCQWCNGWHVGRHRTAASAARRAEKKGG